MVCWLISLNSSGIVITFMFGTTDFVPCWDWQAGGPHPSFKWLQVFAPINTWNDCVKAVQFIEWAKSGVRANMETSCLSGGTRPVGKSTHPTEQTAVITFCLWFQNQYGHTRLQRLLGRLTQASAVKRTLLQWDIGLFLYINKNISIRTP